MTNSSVLTSSKEMINASIEMMNASSSSNVTVAAPAWMVGFVEFRKRLFLQTIEPVIETLLGPLEDDNAASAAAIQVQVQVQELHVYDEAHRRLGFLPDYVNDVGSYRETSMTFSSLMMLFVMLSSTLLIFLSCFYHNQKTSPLFISPRRHRLPKLVPPPLPIDGYFDWVRKRENETWDSFINVFLMHALLSLCRSRFVFIFQMKKSFNALALTP